MPNMERLMLVAYVLSIFTGSYLAVSTLRSLWQEGRKLELISSLSVDDKRYKTLEFDKIEPSAGH